MCVSAELRERASKRARTYTNYCIWWKSNDSRKLSKSHPLSLSFYLSAFQIVTFEYRTNRMWLRNHFIKIQTKLWTTELIKFCKTEIQHSVFARRIFQMFWCIFDLILQKFCIFHSNRNLLEYTYIYSLQKDCKQ